VAQFFKIPSHIRYSYIMLIFLHLFVHIINVKVVKFSIDIGSILFCKFQKFFNFIIIHFRHGTCDCSTSFHFIIKLLENNLYHASKFHFFLRKVLFYPFRKDIIVYLINTYSVSLKYYFHQILITFILIF